MVRILSALLTKLTGTENTQVISAILAEHANREELLGIKPPIIPTIDGIKVDAAKIAKFSDSDVYKPFAKEAWARVIGYLDKILDPKRSNEERQYYCGAVKATLDLLRLSYEAKEILKTPNSSYTDQSASLRPVSK